MGESSVWGPEHPRLSSLVAWGILIKDATMAAEQVLLGYESEALKWWGGFVDALPFYVLLVDEDHRIVASGATQDILANHDLLHA